MTAVGKIPSVLMRGLTRPVGKYPEIVPPHGGEAEFADMYAAYGDIDRVYKPTGIRSGACTMM